MPINVSASKLKELNQCSYIFYCKNVLQLPDKTHWKTLVGSCTHYMVEMTLKPKRKKMLDQILEHGFSFEKFPIFYRYAKQFKYKYKLDLWDISSDIEEMAALAFSVIKPYVFSPEDFDSEKRFVIDLGNGETCSGYVDLVAKKHKRLIDFKTQSQKFTRYELPDNIQAAIYQLWYHSEYKEFVPVDFVMLRHSPTSRTPNKHIQTVEAPTELQIMGLKEYLKHMYYIVNSFGIKEAHTNFCSDVDFCKRVCQFKNPFEYISVRDENNKLVKNYLLDETYQLADNQHIVKSRYNGCPKYN